MTGSAHLSTELPSTISLAGQGAEPGCARRVYKILNEILIAILERTCDDIYIQRGTTEKMPR